MKGDEECAGHTQGVRRGGFPAVGTLVTVGLVFTVTIAGVIFGVHVLQKMDNMQVSFQVCY